MYGVPVRLSDGIYDNVIISNNLFLSNYALYHIFVDHYTTLHTLTITNNTFQSSIALPVYPITSIAIIAVTADAEEIIITNNIVQVSAFLI